MKHAPPLDVLVLGSANIDLSLEVSALPVPGETVLGGARALRPGGKGVNQAVAAAAARARVAFAGCVGDDAEGATLRRCLTNAGVDTAQLRTRSAQASGFAIVLVAPSGENLIAVSPAANGALEPPDVERMADAIRGARILLMQLEIPVPVVAAAMRVAREASTRVVLNFSPAIEVPADVLAHVDVLVVNRNEAEYLLGATVTGLPALLEAAAALRRHGPPAVVITAGGDGAVCADAEHNLHVRAPVVPVVDTTGAGDAFAGTLAAALSRDEALVTAVERAVQAGAAAVQRRGAQPGLAAHEGEPTCG